MKKQKKKSSAAAIPEEQGVFVFTVENTGNKPVENVKLFDIFREAVPRLLSEKNPKAAKMLYGNSTIKYGPPPSDIGLLSYADYLLLFSYRDGNYIIENFKITVIGKKIKQQVKALETLTISSWEAPQDKQKSFCRVTMPIFTIDGDKKIEDCYKTGFINVEDAPPLLITNGFSIIIDKLLPKHKLKFVFYYKEYTPGYKKKFKFLKS